MSNTALSDEFLKARTEDVKKRVSKKRFNHICGVSKTARSLARIYNVDEAEAALAGILHDWDKGFDDEGIRAHAAELGMVDELGAWVVSHMPRVLHGPTAARELSIAFPEIPDRVINAVRKHTTGAVEMTDLDKVIYVADAIEPSRTFDSVDRMRALVGAVSLDELYYQVYKFWTASLVAHDVVLYPETIAIWNDLVAKRKKYMHD